MIFYLLRRLVNYAILLFVAVSLAYILAGTQLDPMFRFREDPQYDMDTIRRLMSSYNLNTDAPIGERYVTWLKGVFTEWDWGRSPTGADVNGEVAVRMWVSLRLIAVGSILGIGLGVAIGAWTATRQYSLSDRAITLVSLIIISTPTVVIITLLQLGANWVNQSLDYQLFEYSGETGKDIGTYWGASAVDRVQHLALPTLTLMLNSVASYSRIQRNLMLDTLGADYVRTARAKGVRHGTALSRHALRTALIPTGTYFAFSMATLFTGSTFVEQLFGWHGMGSYGITTIQNQDINGVVAVTAFGGVCVLTGALLSDIMVSVLDPRVRVS